MHISTMQKHVTSLVCKLFLQILIQFSSVVGYSQLIGGVRVSECTRQLSGLGSLVTVKYYNSSPLNVDSWQKNWRNVLSEYSSAMASYIVI